MPFLIFSIYFLYVHPKYIISSSLDHSRLRVIFGSCEIILQIPKKALQAWRAFFIFYLFTLWDESLIYRTCLCSKPWWNSLSEKIPYQTLRSQGAFSRLYSIYSTRILHSYSQMRNRMMFSYISPRYMPRISRTLISGQQV